MELDLYVRRPERFHGPRGEENKPLGKNSAEILRVLAGNVFLAS